MTAHNLIKLSDERYRRSLKGILTHARTRAKANGIEFDLTEDDVTLPVNCPVLGFKLEWGTQGDYDRSPSLDRFDSSKGYVKGNCHILSSRANRLKNDGTMDELIRVAVWVVEQQLRRDKGEQ